VSYPGNYRFLFHFYSGILNMQGSVQGRKVNQIIE
jgi:hypothetical protein